MKTTFDLPDGLLQTAKAMAARQGRPLRDVVADALGRVVAEDDRTIRINPKGSSEWDLFFSQLEKRPDGTYFNPQGIQDERFFDILDAIRNERLLQTVRDPFEGLGLETGALPSAPAAADAASRRKDDPTTD